MGEMKGAVAMAKDSSTDTPTLISLHSSSSEPSLELQNEAQDTPSNSDVDEEVQYEVVVLECAKHSYHQSGGHNLIINMGITESVSISKRLEEMETNISEI